MYYFLNNCIIVPVNSSQICFDVEVTVLNSKTVSCTGAYRAGGCGGCENSILLHYIKFGLVNTQYIPNAQIFKLIRTFTLDALTTHISTE